MKYLSTLFFVFLSVALIAQPEKKKDEVEILKDQINKWVSIYSQLGKTKDVKSMLAFYTLDYNAIRSSYKITGKLERKPADYSSLKSLLERIIQMDDPRPSYQVNEIYKVAVQGRIAYAVLNASFSLHDGENLIAKGSEIQTLVFRKEEGDWKIAQADILNLVDQQLQDVCGCTIFTSSINEFISKVQRPTGKQYEESLDIFSFKRKADNNILIYVNGEEFTWLTNKEVWKFYDDKSKREKIGREKTEREVVYMILKDYLYKDYCRKIRFND